MNENMKAFLQKVSEDDTLKAKLTEINAAAMSDAKAKIIKLAEESGCTLTEEDMEPEALSREKLDENELNTVAGGAFTDKDSQGKLCSDCFCDLGGGGSSDQYQKTCACVFAGCGELTKKGKQKAEDNEIHWVGHKNAKVAMFCTVLGTSWAL